MFEHDQLASSGSVDPSEAGEMKGGINVRVHLFDTRLSQNLDQIPVVEHMYKLEYTKFPVSESLFVSSIDVVPRSPTSTSSPGSTSLLLHYLAFQPVSPAS
jgi:hypothetical protein